VIQIKPFATGRAGRNIRVRPPFERVEGGGRGRGHDAQGDSEMISKFSMTAFAAAFAGAALLGLQTPAIAADAHQQGHGGAESHKLQLDHGKKWATDEALRKGMSEIRTLIDAQHEGIHKGKLKPADYAALGEKIEAQVGYVVANCKLDAEADANLHIVVGQMLEGVEAMKGKEKKRPRAGAGKVVDALNEYGKYFDHPGWKRL
jgi:hypothetical protein